MIISFVSPFGTPVLEAVFTLDSRSLILDAPFAASSAPAPNDNEADSAFKPLQFLPPVSNATINGTAGDTLNGGNGIDTLDLSATGAENFSDLTIVQDGADVLITSSEFAGTSSIRLLNETAADIDADQFEFSGSSALVVGDTDGFGLNFLTEFSGPSEAVASGSAELAGLSSLFDEADFSVFHPSIGSEFTYDLA